MNETIFSKDKIVCLLDENLNFPYLNLNDTKDESQSYKIQKTWIKTHACN
jgi:hypothetical protein